MCAHVTEVAPKRKRPSRLAEVGLLAALEPELRRLIAAETGIEPTSVSLATEQRTLWKRRRRSRPLSISTLSPLLGHRADHSLVLDESMLRLAMVTALGWDTAKRIRKQARLARGASPHLSRQSLVRLAARRLSAVREGCHLVFRGQWRVSGLWSGETRAVRRTLGRAIIGQTGPRRARGRETLQRSCVICDRRFPRTSRSAASVKAVGAGRGCGIVRRTSGPSRAAGDASVRTKRID